MKFFTSKLFSKIIFCFILASIVFVHVSHLTTNPAGLYVDETSIGLNAAAIATDGVDEYGNAFPLYFEAFGEYKNPIYIYATALVFKIFGVSDFNLRLTSAIFFFLALLAYYLTVCQLTKTQWIRWFCLISLGFLPQYFLLSRVSFEAISLLTFTSWFIYFYLQGFCTEKMYKKQIIFAALAGLFLGLSIYTYSTARLTTFAFAGIVFLLHLRKDHLKTCAAFTGTLLLSLLPWITYVYNNSSHLLGRFQEISYVYLDTSMLHKVYEFSSRCAYYLSPKFQVLVGDIEPRHHIGFYGNVLAIVYMLCALYIALLLVNILRRKRLFQIRNFELFILLAIPITLAPAALTDEYGHSIRILLLGYWFCLILPLVLNRLEQLTLPQLIKKFHVRTVGIAVLFICLLGNIFFYLDFFYNDYQPISVGYFGGYKVQDALQFATQNPAQNIIFSNTWQSQYTYPAYYANVLPELKNKHITFEKLDAYASTQNTCIVYWNEQQNLIDTLARNSEAKQVEFKPKSGTSSVRCFE
jgi:4-amino-4-deoxy-L-arabinose transferase-like glycosyltransferase